MVMRSTMSRDPHMGHRSRVSSRDRGKPLPVRDTGKRIKSCAMIITEPNEFVAEVHDRMPVLLRPDQFGHWLSTVFRSYPQWDKRP
jgi:putative SOS response-associated peptidase YedK